MKIEAHLIQNFAPSCLNRDDTNTPKDCEFGGVRRARISSQCSKRAVREYFKAHALCDLGTRTKRLKQKLAERLSDLPGKPDQLSAALDVFLETYYSKMDSKRADETAVLLYVGQPELQEAAECVRELWSELSAAAGAGDAESGEGRKAKRRSLSAKPEISKRLRAAELSPDIGLFGRMLAELPEMNVDAACQVAHAISTHKVDMDMDFWTAVDDLSPESEPGAGMMGVTHFNSACFYRYALLDRNQLLSNLKTKSDAQVADATIRAFLGAWVYAIPTGKQNSMAAQNLPSFGLFVVRNSGAPCSLANAFASPVRVTLGRDEDLIGRSVQALADYWGRLESVYGSDGVVATALFHTGQDDRLGGLASAVTESVNAAIDATMAAIGSVGGT